ncbi:MAG: TIGR02147 family protein [Bdellovibrionota bacterium]
MRPIFEYRDYRQYLRDYYDEAKKKRRQFSHRFFTSKAGLASPMHLKLVMEGKRNLTHKTLPKFVRGLGLSDREAEYFENLVYFCQASSSSDKSHYLRKLSVASSRTRAKALSAVEHQSLFAKWYYPVLFELVTTRGFQEDPKWISKRLGGRATPGELSHALKVLEESGLLKRDQNRRLVPQSYKVRTDDEVENLLVREFHREMIELSRERIDDPIAEREYGFVTVSTTPAKFREFKKLVKDFVKAVNETLTCTPESGVEPEEVYHLDVQLFKVTR